MLEINKVSTLGSITQAHNEASKAFFQHDEAAAPPLPSPKRSGCIGARRHAIRDITRRHLVPLTISEFDETYREVMELLAQAVTESKRMQDGKPVSSVVQENKYSYFLYQNNRPNASLKIELNSLSGSVQAFISNKTDLPTASHHMWALEAGERMLMIPASELSGQSEISVGVRCHGSQSAEFRICMSAVEGSAVSVFLTDGSPHSAKIEEGYYRYYKVRVENAQNLQVNLMVNKDSSGDADLYMSNKHEFPSKEQHMWSSTNNGSDQLLVTTIDKNWHDGYFYIAVYGVSAASYTLVVCMQRRGANADAASLLSMLRRKYRVRSLAQSSPRSARNKDNRKTEQGEEGTGPRVTIVDSYDGGIGEQSPRTHRSNSKQVKIADLQTPRGSRPATIPIPIATPKSSEVLQPSYISTTPSTNRSQVSSNFGPVSNSSCIRGEWADSKASDTPRESSVPIAPLQQQAEPPMSDYLIISHLSQHLPTLEFSTEMAYCAHRHHSISSTCSCSCAAFSSAPNHCPTTRSLPSTATLKSPQTDDEPIDILSVDLAALATKYRRSTSNPSPVPASIRARHHRPIRLIPSMERIEPILPSSLGSLTERSIHRLTNRRASLAGTSPQLSSFATGTPIVEALRDRNRPTTISAPAPKGIPRPRSLHNPL